MKAITSYYTDGLPSNGLGKNAGRRTAIGYTEGKGIIVSFPAKLNAGRIPEVREVRAILKGESIEKSQGWFECFDGITERGQPGSEGNVTMLETVANAETIGYVHGGAKGLKVGYFAKGRAANVLGFYTCYFRAVREVIAHERGLVASYERATLAATVEGVQAHVDIVVKELPGSDDGCAMAVEHDSGRVTVRMWAIVNGQHHVHTLDAHTTTRERLRAHWHGFVENVRKARAAIPALFSVSVVARQPVQAHSGVKQVELFRLTVNHTDSSDKAEEMREAARLAIHNWTPGSEETAIHEFMSLVADITHRCVPLSWDVVVTFN